MEIQQIQYESAHLPSEYRIYETSSQSLAKVSTGHENYQRIPINPR